MERQQMKKICVNNERINVLTSIILMALFNFLFLGTEYLFDNMMAYAVDSEGVVLAQSYILGASVLGFVIFPVVSRRMSSNTKRMLLFCGTVFGVICIFVIQQHLSYAAILFPGLIFFTFLGAVGSGVHYWVFCVFEGSRHLAKMMGAAYALGIFLQFVNHNCVKNDVVKAVILSVSLMFFLILILKLKEETTFVRQEGTGETEKDRVTLRSRSVAAGALVACVVFMTCVFSTLDNAVTLVHASGSVDIGQWPRLLLALSGLTAGFLYDLKERRFMNLMMYSVTLLSTICVVVIQSGGSFLVGLIVFYLSAGFFVVFFTVSFMELAHYMKIPEFWAGIGRAINNICAVMTSALSVMLLSSKNSMAIIITALILFVLISIAIYVYQSQFRLEEMKKSEQPVIDDTDKFAAFSEQFSLTDREQDVLKVLLESDENVQEIAEQILISRAALYRHITSLNEKTETKSRIGLLQFYYSWKKEN